MARIVARKTRGRMHAFLQSKRQKLKEELDRIYYTMPYDQVRGVLLEIKDTIDGLSELGNSRDEVKAAKRRAA